MNEINWGKASRSTKQWISRQQCTDSINRWGRKSSTLILIINQLLCNFMFKQPIGVRTVRFIFFLFDNLYQFVLNPTEFQVSQGHLCLEIISFPKIRVFSEMQGVWFDWLKISQTSPIFSFSLTQWPKTLRTKIWSQLMYLKYRLMYTEVASTHHSHYAVIENKIIFKSCFSFLQSNKKVFC